MSKVERKEYQETKVMRTLSPGRHRSSTQNLAEFDSNLDNLLEDLQASVSRPGSALGHSTNTYRETSRAVNTLDAGRSSSLSRIANVRPSNPVTEYSSDDAFNYSSPDGRKHVSGYKKESYSYKTSGSAPVAVESVRAQNSINQLDSLLDDLKQVKQAPLDHEPYNNIGGDPAFSDSQVNKSVRRELHYGDTPKSSSRGRTLERQAALSKDIQYSSEGTYGDIRQIRPTSPSPSRSSTLSKQTKVTNVHTYPMAVVETITPDINPEILDHLDPHLRPPGNTKVTTTIKTYTYEIPGSGDYPTNLVDSNITYDRYSPNQSQTTPSKSFVYNKMDKSLENTTIEYSKQIPPPAPTTHVNKIYHSSTSDVSNTYQQPGYQRPTPPPGSTTVKEVVTSYQPGYSPERNPPGNQQTYIYNETSTTKNVDTNGYPIYPADQRDHLPNSPPRHETYIYKEVHNTTNTNVNKQYPDDRDFQRKQPPREIIPPHQTTIIKESHNTTTNLSQQPYPNGYPYYPKEPSNVGTVIYKEEKHTTNNYVPVPGNRPHTPTDTETFDPHNPPYPKSGPRRPNEPVNINYKYITKSQTTNNYKTGYQPQSETEPLLPRPFPTDDSDGPPKKLDELMATIGHEPPSSPLNIGFTVHEQELLHQKKVETLKQQAIDKEEEASLQKKELQKTKNVSGPPVYYPPGHEMFAKKEEAAGAWRAEGGYAKESGKYAYEAESGSKMKTRSGAAVVPVCLPLCCGLPCTIL